MQTTLDTLTDQEFLTAQPVRTMTAKQVLSQYWDGTLPIRPEVVARRMGAEVFGDLDGKNGSGMIQLHDDGHITIHFCPTEAQVRQRFTVAHEIGHWAAGHLSASKTCFRDFPDAFFSGVSGRQERQANQFAAELLMPADAVEWAVQDGRWPSLDMLASLFGVSTAAMGYRMQNLGLI